MGEEEVKKMVREGYSRIAKNEGTCCGPVDLCCGGDKLAISKGVGYSDDELKMVPQGANLGLGCGNPVALATLKEGETVLDLGSGAGIDCFLASERVGNGGKVIGIDMTPEMVERARKNAGAGDYTNVEFRLGEIEDLPVDDGSVDVVISNCVINLSPDKTRVFREAHRVLRPGGRLMISDIVLLRDLPDFIKDSVEAYIGCLSGAMLKEDYLDLIRGAGFYEVQVMEESTFPVEFMTNDPTVQRIIQDLKVTPEEVERIGGSVVSIKVRALKPIRSTLQGSPGTAPF